MIHLLTVLLRQSLIFPCDKTESTSYIILIYDNKRSINHSKGFKMKYSNHQEVYDFGFKSFKNNISNLGKYEEGGSINSYRGVEDGLSIIVRLGNPNEIQSARELVILKLNDMKVESFNYETSEDRSAISYLDNDRRNKDIGLLEYFLIRMENIKGVVSV